MENLCEAWCEFILGKRKKKDVQEFQLRLMDELGLLHGALISGGYRHGGYYEFRINDPKPRVIHKASVRDRLLHHAIHRKLYPFFDRVFISDSFSCRTGKGVHRALNRFQSMARKVSWNHIRTCWVLKCDIRKFFASVDHFVLARELEKRVMNRDLLELLFRVIESFSALPAKGIPLGNLTSQLFANIYMHPLDLFVKQELYCKYYIRYADDFVFLSDDRSELEGLLIVIRCFLSEKLALDLHPDKVILKTIASGVDFLGWVHFPHHRILRTKTKRRAIKRVRQKPEEATLQSYLGMLEHGDAQTIRQELLNDYWMTSHEIGPFDF